MAAQVPAASMIASVDGILNRKGEMLLRVGVVPVDKSFPRDSGKVASGAKTFKENEDSGRYERWGAIYYRYLALWGQKWGTARAPIDVSAFSAMPYG